MGIKGLSKFIFDNHGLVKPYKLHDSYVVIDGDNLLYPLYYGNKINVVCGGDYNEYAEYIRNYFCTFLECNIQPIVIFDGGYDKSGRKLKTVFQRTNDRLTTVKNIVQNKMYNKQVLPIFGKNLFICILNELNIPVGISDYEADDQVTALANYYKCPVISADNDFFISDVHNGFILLDSIETVITSATDANGKEYKYLNCNIYYIDKLLLHFPKVEKSVLPLLKILLGNDYFQQCEFDNFFVNMRSLKGKRIIKLLNWLRGKSLNNAMREVLSYVKEEKREYVRAVIENTVKNSNVHSCNLCHIISQKLNNTKCDSSFHSGLTGPCGNSLPLDFIIKYHSGHYFSYFANVIVLHKLFLNPQIDDFHSQSSYKCARYIRRVIYGILIHHDVNGVTCKNERCLAPIEEYDRHEDRLEKEIIKPIFILESIGMLPKIDDLRNLETDKAKLILMKVLGINSDFVADLPAEWQLFFGSINYWLRNSLPYCTEAFLCSLIVNFICHEIIRPNNPDKKVIKCWNDHAYSSFTHILSKINQSELQYATEVFKKYLSKPSLNHDTSLCLNIVHCYCQLQSCLLSTVSLNKLLGTCMKNPDIRCLSGSLLYNLTKDISIQENPKLFIDEILGKGALSQIFTLLYSKACHDISSDHILKNAPNV